MDPAVSRRNVIRREPLKFWRSRVNTGPLDPAFIGLRACALNPTRESGVKLNLKVTTIVTTAKLSRYADSGHRGTLPIAYRALMGLWQHEDEQYFGGVAPGSDSR